MTHEAIHAVARPCGHKVAGLGPDVRGLAVLRTKNDHFTHKTRLFYTRNGPEDHFQTGKGA